MTFNSIQIEVKFKSIQIKRKKQKSNILSKSLEKSNTRSKNWNKNQRNFTSAVMKRKIWSTSFSIRTDVESDRPY